MTLINLSCSSKWMHLKKCYLIIVFLLKKIAVVFGGKACEREISIITGTFVCNLLRGGKYEVVPVYLDENGRAFSSPLFFEIGNIKKEELLKKAERILIDDGTMYALNDKNVGKIMH